jgi:hypothetical protein
MMGAATWRLTSICTTVSPAAGHWSPFEHVATPTAEFVTTRSRGTSGAGVSTASDFANECQSRPTSAPPRMTGRTGACRQKWGKTPTPCGRNNGRGGRKRGRPLGVALFVASCSAPLALRTGEFHAPEQDNIRRCRRARLFIGVVHAAPRTLPLHHLRGADRDLELPRVQVHHHLLDHRLDDLALLGDRLRLRARAPGTVSARL